MTVGHPVQGTPHMDDMDSSFFRQGNYRPVADEVSADDLSVTGAIPPQLSGWYLRNGPNPRAATGHWFIGEGMIHGVRLEHGRARWYRNRWVRTANFVAGGGSIYQPDGTRDLTVASANTHVVNHAGRTLALVETSLPYEVDLDLQTRGVYDFGGKLADSMTAHPKICPVTGELHFFGSGNLEQPHVTYHRANAAGELTVEQPIQVPGLTMMHDFHLTAAHAVFMDLPVIFDRDMIGRAGLPYRWDDDYGARLGVLRRDEPSAPVRWFEIEPCYVFHGANAYDDGSRIVMHVVRYPTFWRGGERTAASLWRWTIDLAAGHVEQVQVDDRVCEFPRIDDRLCGLPARFTHVTNGAAAGGRSKSIIRYDLHVDSVEEHRFPDGQVPGEAVFIPADSRPGSEGWLMTYVYDAARDASDLVILDSTDLAGAPVATVHLPVRVPYGFHGNWIADVL